MFRWFEAFDSNNDGELNRDELRVLLTDLHPDNPPDEKMLDHLIERATAIESSSLTLAGRVDGTVGRASAMKTVDLLLSSVEASNEACSPETSL